MQDRVADVLAQRSSLDRGAGAGVVVSVLLHAALGGLVIYTTLHAPAPKPAPMVSIQFANLPAMTKPAEAPPKKVTAPKIDEPKPVISEPKPIVPPVTSKTPPPQKPEKNTVPLSPFGQSTKKGSETPAPPPPTATAPPAAAPSGPQIAVGGSGITGLEGGDFPYTLYLEGMQKRIGTNWFRPTVAPGTECIIYYRIQRDGKITDARVDKPSNNPTFDRAALSAVRSSTPFNPLPYAYSGTYLGVHLTFR